MQKKAFTLVEILIVIAVIGILGTAILPAIGKSVEKARVAKVYRVVETLEAACEAYTADTARYAVEYPAAYAAGAGGANHTLTNSSSYSGLNWKGPYLKRPLQNSDNPFNTNDTSVAAIYVGNNLTDVFGKGFDTDGDGVIDRNETGNYLYLNSSITAIPSRIAKMINDQFDSGVSNVSSWENTGLVKYNTTSGNVAIYLTGGY